MPNPKPPTEAEVRAWMVRFVAFHIAEADEGDEGIADLVRGQRDGLGTDLGEFTERLVKDWLRLRAALEDARLASLSAKALGRACLLLHKDRATLLEAVRVLDAVMRALYTFEWSDIRHREAIAHPAVVAARKMVEEKPT